MAAAYIGYRAGGWTVCRVVVAEAFVNFTTSFGGATCLRSESTSYCTGCDAYQHLPKNTEPAPLFASFLAGEKKETVLGPKET